MYKIKFHGIHSCDLVRDTSSKTINKPSQVCIKSLDMFILYYFEYKASLSSSRNNIIYLSLVHFLVEQARAYLQVTWLTYYFPIYSKTITKMF